MKITARRIAQIRNMLEFDDIVDTQKATLWKACEDLLDAIDEIVDNLQEVKEYL